MIKERCSTVARVRRSFAISKVLNKSINSFDKRNNVIVSAPVIMDRVPIQKREFWLSRRVPSTENHHMMNKKSQ